MMLRNTQGLASTPRASKRAPMAGAPAAPRRGALRAVAAFGNAAPQALRLAVRALPKALSRRPTTRVQANWGAPVEFSAATVKASAPAAAGLQKVMIDVGGLAAGYTKAGQYMQVKVGDSKPGFFAIASAPGAATTLEFLIKPQPGSTAEALVALPAGAAVSVSPVQGKGFAVEKIPAADFPAVLIFATGSGISPIKALIESGALGQRPDVRLYYGARSPEAAAYGDAIDGWRKAGVKVTQVFSSSGKGYVQDAFAADAPVADWKRAAVLLCGQKEMANAVKELAAARGIDAANILMNF